MIKLVREAIETILNLPEDRQKTLAQAILDYASHDDDLYHLTDAERSEARAGLAEIKSGEDEVQDLYRRIGV
ncbi:MAG: hypothetical protein ACKVP3_12575 [Hyphomicrobiaceae bacterium]